MGGGTAYSLESIGEATPYGIAVDSTRVFWADGDGGTVKSKTIGEGIVATLASGQSSPYGIVVNSVGVYWISNNVIYEWTIGGGLTTLVSGYSPKALAAGNEDIYWTDDTSNTLNQIYLTTQITTLVSRLNTPTALALNANDLFWLNDGTTNKSIQEVARFDDPPPSGDSCSSGSLCTSGDYSYCAQESSDPNNCGSCGNVCGSVTGGIYICSSGSCTISCNPGFVYCANNTCVPGQSVANGAVACMKEDSQYNCVLTCTMGTCNDGQSCIATYGNGNSGNGNSGIGSFGTFCPPTGPLLNPALGGTTVANPALIVTPSTILPGAIQYVIVIMQENKSFDSILGALDTNNPNDSGTSAIYPPCYCDGGNACYSAAGIADAGFGSDGGSCVNGLTSAGIAPVHIVNAPNPVTSGGLSTTHFWEVTGSGPTYNSPENNGAGYVSNWFGLFYSHLPFGEAFYASSGSPPATYPTWFSNGPDAGLYGVSNLSGPMGNYESLGHWYQSQLPYYYWLANNFECRITISAHS